MKLLVQFSVAGRERNVRAKAFRAWPGRWSVPSVANDDEVVHGCGQLDHGKKHRFSFSF